MSNDRSQEKSQRLKMTKESKVKYQVDTAESLLRYSWSCAAVQLSVAKASVMILTLLGAPNSIGDEEVWSHSGHREHRVRARDR
jgi:hypothetical protein